MSSHEADVHGVSDVLRLPEDPEDGEVYRAPENTYLGGSIVISVFRGRQLLGSAQRLQPVPSVSRKYQLLRLNSVRLLKKGDLINIKTTHNIYNELVFKNGYGWLGNKSSETAEVLQEGYFRVSSFLTVGPYDDNYRLYEYVCMDKIKEKR